MSAARSRGSFRVVPGVGNGGEEIFVVVAPTGVSLYSFTDLHDATTEAATLNASRAR
jgi:hypothetical protein